MNGQTARLLRKAAGEDRENYKKVKALYAKLDPKAKAKALDLAREVKFVRGVEKK